MKKTVFIILVLLVAIQTFGFSQKKNDNVLLKPKILSPDSSEYKLVVFDPAFESWLITQPPENFYSNEYYAHKNRLYVMEWNIRCVNSLNSRLTAAQSVNKSQNHSISLKNPVAQSPESFHSQEYTHMPAEPTISNTGSQNSWLYETPIDYNPRIDYGLDLNYRLYYFFLYFERNNNIRILD